jgi:nitroimidazol reductase NimA-like FMN-containing flavoprotein (pyridoxamine 5'-phosphate oxidase superfamily)
MTERDQMEKLLAEATHGFLGLTGPDGWPRRAAQLRDIGRKLYFHGATEGEKMDRSRRTIG